jgi:hypothetical protein
LSQALNNNVNLLTLIAWLAIGQGHELLAKKAKVRLVPRRCDSCSCDACAKEWRFVEGETLSAVSEDNEGILALYNAAKAFESTNSFTKPTFQWHIFAVEL